MCRINPGGEHVNGRANLLVLAPTDHWMYDKGTMRLEPGFDWRMYQISFLYHPLALRRTAPFNSYASAELKNGDWKRAWNICGSLLVHMVMSRFCRAILTSRFSPWEAGKLFDLGPHLVKG